MTAKHTPTPWTVHENAPFSVWCANQQVATCRWTERYHHGAAGYKDEIGTYAVHNSEEAQANAAHIVRCVNAHAKVLCALEEIVLSLPTDSVARKQINDLLKEMRGL